MADSILEKWTVGGPIDRWVGKFPNQKIRMAFYQLSNLPIVDKIDTLVILEKLQESYPDQPFVLARLAELYWLLQHMRGASQLVLQVLRIIGKTDAVFIRWAQCVIDQNNRDNLFQRHLYHNFPKTRYVFYSKKLSPIDYYNVVEQCDLSQKIAIIWGLSNKNEMYYRKLCLENNKIEDVFRLQEKSEQQLIQYGFFDNLVHFDMKSKNKNNIIDILKDTQHALDQIISWPIDGEFSEEFIIDVHKTIMKSDRINIKVDEITKKPYCVLAPIGEWRYKTVYASQPGNLPNYVMFHPFYKIAESMRIFIVMVQKLFKSIKLRKYDHDPYTMAAWIHHALYSIHPFEDGNDRMSRLIASMPLTMLGLPPICISSKNKHKYLQVLKDANDMNIGPLAEFLALESLEIIQHL